VVREWSQDVFKGRPQPEHPTGGLARRGSTPGLPGKAGPGPDWAERSLDDDQGACACTSVNWGLRGAYPARYVMERVAVGTRP
jgi:hypothetical protein